MYPDRGKGIKRQRKKHKDHSCASREVSCPSRIQTGRCQYRTKRTNKNSSVIYGVLARQNINSNEHRTSNYSAPPCKICLPPPRWHLCCSYQLSSQLISHLNTHKSALFSVKQANHIARRYKNKTCRTGCGGGSGARHTRHVGNVGTLGCVVATN